MLIAIAGPSINRKTLALHHKSVDHSRTPDRHGWLQTMDRIFTYLPVVKADRDHLFELHRVSLGPYVDQLFGWEEELQRHLFDQKFTVDHCYWIVVDQLRVGAVSYQIHPERFYLEKIEIYPEFQRQGYGSRVITDILSEADAKSLAVELQVFKINPAIALYKRLGFSQMGETDIHLQLRRSPQSQ
ncbi:MAG: GNAT family N-acetyltransferase [Leptolyngbya sp. SIOISBB]|nr:GNAT family N-acetyltransferase [Leptolyngbya sp. SIOISBB]